MRKLKLQVQVSIDGFVAGPNGEMDWMVWNWDNPLKDYVGKIVANVDCIILGRRLAEGFIDAWANTVTNPESSKEDVDFAHKVNDTVKIIFSKTMSTIKPAWKNTTLAKGDLADEVNKLKKLPGNDMIVYGGANFVSNLIEAGLIDEFYFFVNPSILGTGMPIFKKLVERENLKLVDTFTSGVGIIVLCYKLRRG